MWKNLPYKNCIYFSIAINLLSAILILVLKGLLPPVVPFFYGLPDGIEQLVPSLGLIIAPAIGLVITAINIFLCRIIHEVFLKKVLIISTAFISLLLVITNIKIVLLVGFF
jgi:hypothetical protein